MAFNQTWNDAFEDVPADGDQIKFGADKIRDLKEGMRERLQIDHEMGEADGAGTDTGVDTGYHKKITLKVATPATPPAGYLGLGAAANNLYYKGSSGMNRTVVNTDEAQTLTSKTLNGASNVLNSCDINTPDIDGGSIDGTAISGGTVSSATISSSPISGSTGSFTTLAASSLATLSAGITTGVGTLKWKIYTGSTGTLIFSTLPTQTIAHGLVNDDSSVVLGAFYTSSQRDSAFNRDWIYGFADTNETNIIFTPSKGSNLVSGNAWEYIYNVIIFYRA